MCSERLPARNEPDRKRDREAALSHDVCGPWESLPHAFLIPKIRPVFYDVIVPVHEWG